MSKLARTISETLVITNENGGPKTPVSLFESPQDQVACAAFLFFITFETIG